MILNCCLFCRWYALYSPAREENMCLIRLEESSYFNNCPYWTKLSCARHRFSQLMKEYLWNPQDYFICSYRSGVRHNISVHYFTIRLSRDIWLVIPLRDISEEQYALRRELNPCEYYRRENSYE